MAGLPIAVQNQRPRIKLHNLLATLMAHRAIVVAEKRSKPFVGTVGGYNGFVRTGMVPAPRAIWEIPDHVYIRSSLA